MSNAFAQEYINKASVITPSSFTAPASLSVDEADRFIDYVVDQSFMKANARVERMNAPTKTIAKVGIGQNILKPAKSATDPGNTVSFTTDQLTLETKEIIAIAEISDDSLEDNIEGDAFVDHLMKMIASQSANELEAMCMYGKRLSNPTDATYINQLVDGWMTIARESGHVLDGRDNTVFADANGYMVPEKLSRTIKTLPNKYRGNKANLRFLVADDIYQDYNDYMGARAVSTADPYLLGVGRLTYSNVPLQSVSLMPTDRPVVDIAGTNDTIAVAVAAGATSFTMADATGVLVGDVMVLNMGGAYEEVVTVSVVAGNVITVTEPLTYLHAIGHTVKECVADGTEMLLTDYRNLLFGIQRDIKWETERHPRRRSTSFVMTLRVDTQIENPDALVILENLKSK